MVMNEVYVIGVIRITKSKRYYFEAVREYKWLEQALTDSTGDEIFTSVIPIKEFLNNQKL